MTLNATIPWHYLSIIILFLVFILILYSILFLKINQESSITYFLLDYHSNNEYNSIQWLKIYYDLFIIQKTDDEREFSSKNHFFNRNLIRKTITFIIRWFSFHFISRLIVIRVGGTRLSDKKYLFIFFFWWNISHDDIEFTFEIGEFWTIGSFTFHWYQFDSSTFLNKTI